MIDSLYARHATTLYRRLLRITRNAQLADDMAQDVWLKAIMSGAHTGAWLYQAARSRVADEYRRKVYELELFDSSLDTTDMEALVMDRITCEEVFAAMKTESQRRVMALWLQGYESPEIGVMLGISERAANQLRTRAKAVGKKSF